MNVLRKGLFLPPASAFLMNKGGILKPWTSHYFAANFSAFPNDSKLSGSLMCIVLTIACNMLTNSCNPYRMGLEIMYFSDHVSVLRNRLIFNNLKSVFCHENRSFSRKKVSEKGVILITENNEGYNLLIWVWGLGRTILKKWLAQK